MATNDGGPAFPATVASEGDPAWPCYQMHDDTKFVSDAYEAPGMSLRDYMAAKAMQAMVANPETCTSEASVEGAAKVIAHWAYIQADAMLAAREANP